MPHAPLHQLRLRQFRNYSRLAISFAPGLTVLHGRNGQGKTNILEAVFYLGLLRSFRTHRVSALKQWQCDEFQVGGTLAPRKGEGRGLELDVVYGERRTLRVDGGAVERPSEFINQFICLCLVPEDIAIVKGGAAVRRRFLDILISQLRPAYLHHLQQYLACLRRRNAVLRDPVTYPSGTLAAFDRYLVDTGAEVVVARTQIAGELNRSLADLSRRLFGDGGADLELRLRTAGIGTAKDVPTVPEAQTALEKMLERGKEADRRHGYTRQGPHRDDFSVRLGDRRLADYGSEGECRMACLALRLAALELAVALPGRGTGVVLLVDDVMGELDPLRKEAFWGCLSRADQVLMTVTDVPEELSRKAAHLLTVEQGTVT